MFTLVVMLCSFECGISVTYAFTEFESLGVCESKIDSISGLLEDKLNKGKLSFVAEEAYCEEM